MSIETSGQERPNADTIAIGKGPLINRNFALLAIGQAISNMGDFVYSTTLLVWVFALTHSAAAVSGILIAQYAPIFVLGPIAGVFVDRWNRRSTMVVADLARVGLTLLPLIAPVFLRLPTIYASVFLLSAFSRFFMPARAGMQQVIVAEQQQAQAASIGQATFALSIIIGPAIASPLYFLVGPSVALAINAASFLVSALCLRAMRVPKEALHPHLIAEAGPQQTGIRAVIHELLIGFRFVAKTRVLLVIVILVLVAMLGAGALNALDIIFVSQNLHVSTSLYGPLTAVGGLGVLIGAVCAGLLATRIKPKHMLVGSIILLGLGIVVYSFQTWYLIALILNFLIGIPNGGIEVGFAPMLFGVTPKALMGRVQSVFEMATFAISLLSAALAGYFGQFIPVSFIFALGGVLITLSGIFGGFGLPKEVPTQSSPENNQESVLAPLAGTKLDPSR